MNEEITRADLIAYLEDGSKPPSEWACGLEYEKFAYRTKDLLPLTYDGGSGLELFLKRFAQRFGWQEGLEDGHVVGLKSPAGLPKASITTEPAGQVELSGAPFKSIHENFAEIETYKKQTALVAQDLGIGFLSMGYAPVWKLTDMHPIPKKRYGVISRYMAQNSVMGIDMMYRTCTVQVNIDFSDEADMLLKLRVGLALQPIVSALFATSPFVEGAPNGLMTNRANIWRYADRARTGLLPEAFDEGFGFERYVDYALAVPIYFVERDGLYLDAQGQTFGDFVEGKLDILSGQRPNLNDWETHLATIYPEARLKKFIEMRGADSGWSTAHLIALPAFWTGILYDRDCLQAAWDLVKGWNEETREAARHQAIHYGLRGKVGSQSLQELAGTLVDLAQVGLDKRGRINDKGEGESIYLDLLHQRVANGNTAADDLLALYKGAWNGDCSHIFKTATES